MPGSQNGYNHSSKLGTINFMAGVMGVANAQRTLDIIRCASQAGGVEGSSALTFARFLLLLGARCHSPPAPHFASPRLAALTLHRTLTQFISQEEYRLVVPMFSVLNEPYGPGIGVDEMRHL